MSFSSNNSTPKNKKNGSIFSSGSGSGSIFMSGSGSDSPTNKMLSVLHKDNNNETKDKFIEYIEKTYNQENEQFLINVQYYKQEYYDKSEKWKINVCQRIIRNYITVDSPMQINISENHRNTILKCSMEIPPHIDIFDNAFREITEILVNGVWKVFMLEQDKPETFINKALGILKVKNPMRPSLEKMGSKSSRSSRGSKDSLNE